MPRGVRKIGVEQRSRSARAPTHKLQKLTLADALHVVASMGDQDRHALKAMLGDFSDEFVALNRWQTEGPAWTMVRAGEPVAIFGLSISSPWLAVAWLVATPAMRGDSWRNLIRHCRIVVGNVKTSPIHRTEAHVLAGWTEAERFARHLGFSYEGTRHMAGRDGQDVQTFVMIGDRNGR